MSHRRRGFTLTEILVVCVTVAILVAITIPVVASARKRAKEAACVSNLRQIHAALSLYRSDYDGEGKYGTTRQMGLPNDLSILAKDQRLPKAIFECQSDRPMVAKHPLYNAMYLGDHGGPWDLYVKQMQENAVLLSDHNHDRDGVPPFSPHFTHNALGVFLDGHTKWVSRKGDWFSYDWWTGP